MSLNILFRISYPMYVCPPNDATLYVSLYPGGTDFYVRIGRVGRPGVLDAAHVSG